MLKKNNGYVTSEPFRRLTADVERMLNNGAKDKTPADKLASNRL
jgi:hypothetical protein